MPTRSVARTAGGIAAAAMQRARAVMLLIAGITVGSALLAVVFT
ncbi:hypothetical protein [Streptomyces sp. A5-4]